MGGRVVQLSGEAGINRLKAKGGPPKNTLYDLRNGYIDATGCAVARPGTTEAYTLPAGTKGMCAFGGGLVVFSHQQVTGLPAGVTCEVLTHPDDPTDALLWIHFAGPFLGYLYVVAEFESGDVYHYWLESADTWAANEIYYSGAIVQPTIPNGYAYRAVRTLEQYPVWKAGEKREVGDRVEPSTPNDYYYEVIEIQQGAPGSVTPTTPTENPTPIGRTELSNPTFEEGNVGWNADPANLGTFTITEDATKAYAGSWYGRYVGPQTTGLTDYVFMDRVQLSRVPSSFSASARMKVPLDLVVPNDGAVIIAALCIRGFDSSGTQLWESIGTSVVSGFIAVPDEGWLFCDGRSTSTPAVYLTTAVEIGLQVKVVRADGAPPESPGSTFEVWVDNFAWGA